MTFEIIPPQLAVKAMRDSGYKDAAHAVSELVDNSIQAGAEAVEILCVDENQHRNNRSSKRLNGIAVYDTGCGMDKDILMMALQFGNGTHLELNKQKGIGKFGMGLPNSSISQCKKVEVWTWQDNKVLYSYLSVDEIMQGELKVVPEPITTELPEKWVALFQRYPGESGTLVVWSELDRVRWKGSKALLSNASFLIGRMYRNFINNKETSIRLAAFSPTGTGGYKIDYDEFVRPNDPMYLINNSMCPPIPEPYAHESLFESYGADDLVSVKIWDGEEHTVTIRYAIVNHYIRKKIGEEFSNPGDSPIGKNTRKNVGISVVRAERELEMNMSFVSVHDSRERWWGIEVIFPPALDEYFGVTNNKQAATTFYQMNLDDDAETEGMTVGEYKQMLEEEQDPRLLMYEISRRIDANLSSIRAQLRRYSEGARKRNINPDEDKAARAASTATEARKKDGHLGDSDAQDYLSDEEKIVTLAAELENQGVDSDEAREIAITNVTSKIKYIFREAGYDGSSFFTMSSHGPSIIVTINKNHPTAKYFYELLDSSEGETSNKALDALKLMICAWSRMEDETQNPVQKQKLSDIRADWGKMVREFYNVAFAE